MVQYKWIQYCGAFFCCCLTHFYFICIWHLTTRCYRKFNVKRKYLIANLKCVKAGQKKKKNCFPPLNVINHLHKKTNVFRGAFKTRCQRKLQRWTLLLLFASDVRTLGLFMRTFSSSAQFTRLQVNRFSADVEIKGCIVRRLPDVAVAPFAHLLHTVQDKLDLGNMTSKWGRQRPETILSASVRSSGYAKADRTANTVCAALLLILKNLSIINTSEYTVQLFFHIIFIK